MKLRTLLLLTISLLFSLSAQAVTFWRCTSYNRNWSKHWNAKRSTRYDAIIAAKRLCRENAWHPDFCTVPLSSCTRISINPNWNCVVRDHRNRRWSAYNCQEALHQCRHWHRRNDMDNWNCWVIPR